MLERTVELGDNERLDSEFLLHIENFFSNDQFANIFCNVLNCEQPGNSEQKSSLSPNSTVLT